MKQNVLFRWFLVGALVTVPGAAAAESAAAPAAVETVQGDPAMAALLRYAEDLAAREALYSPAAPEADGAPDPTCYRLVDVRSDEIDRHMLIADGRNGIPESLQGLFWMDGNPLPDKIVSFASSTWDAEQKKISIEVYGENIWSWHDDLAGRALWTAVRKFELVYELQLNDALDFAVITPVIRIGHERVRVPESLVRFTARLVGDGVWLRESYFAGKLSNTYTFRRVVKADGTREPAFADYVKAAPAWSVLAVEKR